MNWALLSKEERREVARAIDYILDFLLFVPVRKETSPERQLFGAGAKMAATEENLGKVEQKLADVLLEGWNTQAQKAINKGAALLQSFEGDIDEKEIKLLLSTIAREMGPGLQAMTQEQVTNLVGTAYILGRKLVGQQVGTEPKLDLIDEQARQWLADHTVFWIGDYYDSHLGENIAGTVRQLALEQGLGREEVGRQLKAALGDRFAKSDVYWRGLAATTVDRARNFGGVQSMVEAQVSEYEILAVMDERTSPICRFMNGKVFKVEHAVALRDAVLNAKTPEDIKAIHPWRQVKEVQAWSTEKLAAGGMALPPYHFHCFPPGTMVMTIDGPRPIEQISEGELVLTHTGQWKPVKATMARFHEGELLVVNGQIASTPEHPYLAYTPTGIKWVPAAHVKNCSLLQVVLQSQWKSGGESYDQQHMSDMRQGISSVSFPQPREVLFARVPESGESKGVYWADQGKTLPSSQGDPGVPAMRERISGSREPDEDGQGCLLQQRVQSQSLGYQSYTGLCGLRETVSEEQSLSGKGLWEILLPGLPEQSQERGEALQVERRAQDWQKGLYIRVSAGPSLCQQPRVCAATPPCDGEVAGALPYPRRSGSPQERYCDRQQAGELDALPEQHGAPGISQGTRWGFEWTPVISLERQYYRGFVYNLEVKGDESYFANGVAVHNCRTTYIVSTFAETTVIHEPLDIQFERTKPQSELPPMEKLEYVGSGAYLGGAGQKIIYQDKSGQQYIFKPAVSKGGKPEPFRAYVQEAASEIGKRLYDPGQFVEVKVVVDKLGRLGTLQKLFPDVEGNLKQINWQSLTPEDWRQIQREHVLDWAIGNFDSHGGNFIVLKDGRMLATDKEQAFRYMADTKSWKMSLDYHPNAVYGEQEPIYNTIYRAFAKKEVDLDLQAVLPALQRLEAIPDEEYRAILRPYAEALHGKGEKAEAFLDQAVSRKQEAREQFRQFFTSLLKARDPKFKGTFKFADEMTGAEMAKAPLAARVMTKEELQKLNTKALKEMAKAQQIKYFQQMTKEELVEALANPDKASALSMAAKERTRARLRAAIKEPPLPKLEAPSGADILEDFNQVPRTPFGIAVRKDGKRIEGQQITIRRIEEDGQAGFQVTMKIPQAYHGDVEKALKKMGAGRGSFTFQAGRPDRTTGVHQMTRREHTRVGQAWYLSDQDVAVYFAGTTRERALMGQLEIRIYETDGVRAAKRAQEILKKLNLEAAIADPTPEEERLLRLSRLAWQHAPREEYRIGLEGRTVEQMERLLREKGIDPARANKLVEKEVWPGYKTFVEEGISKEYQKLGAEYLFAGVSEDPQVVVDILSPDSPGLMSTLQRYLNGMLTNRGASQAEDIVSGGADSAFVRLVPRDARGKYRFRDSFKGNGYRLIIDVSEMDRTDWYAYGHDNYGGVGEDRGFQRRLGAEEFVARRNSSYRPSNEVMFRRGIRKESIIGVTCDTERQRQALIKALRQAGFKEVNGKKLEEFVRVQEMI